MGTYPTESATRSGGRALLGLVMAPLMAWTCVAARAAPGVLEFAAAQRERTHTQVPHEVLAFYYTWYGRPPQHWGRVDAARHDIQEATHYPARGAYDSHDPAIIDWQIDSALAHGVTGFIATWWGQRAFEDRAVPLVLEAARRKEFKVTLYWETAPGTGRQQIDQAVSDLVYMVTQYGKNPAFLKVDGKPVIFVYGRVMQQVPLASWPAIVTEARTRAGDFLLIADGYREDYAQLFDGVHTYNICGEVRGKSPEQLRTWAAQHYAGAVAAARRTGRISCVTVIPGYDDTKIRKPGLRADRQDGQTYRVLWEEASRAQPDWVLITSWNEWHEGSEIEPSFEDGEKYLALTGDCAPRFHNGPPVKVTVPDRRNPQLQQLYAGRSIAVLPGFAGAAPFWLVDAGVTPQELTWADLVDAGRFNARLFPLALYAGGEHYVGTVKETGDVKRALLRYLSEGGFLVVIPSEPWPFYYDDTLGRAAPLTGDLGLPLGGGWEKPPAGATLRFIVNDTALPGLPVGAAFPQPGDLRWCPAMAARANAGDKYVSLVELRDATGRSYGDGIAYIERKSGGRLLYVGQRLPEALGVEDCLTAVFKFCGAKQ